MYSSLSLLNASSRFVMSASIACAGIVKVTPGFGGGINTMPTMVAYVAGAIVSTICPSCPFTLWEWMDAAFLRSKRLTSFMVPYVGHPIMGVMFLCGNLDYLVNVAHFSFVFYLDIAIYLVVTSTNDCW